MEYLKLDGIWQADIGDGRIYELRLPGTLDEGGIGTADKKKEQFHPDVEKEELESGKEEALIDTRLTRRHTYEGKVRLNRRIAFCPPEGCRVFLEAERARCLKAFLDGFPLEEYEEASISTPYIYEVTGKLSGENEICFVSDNSYPGMPHDAIVYSSAATDETQTNWNGIVGYLRLRLEKQIFIRSIAVYPFASEKGCITLTVHIFLDAATPFEGKLTVRSEALEKTAEKEIAVPAGKCRIDLEGLRVRADARPWDEYRGQIYELSASIETGEEKKVCFGIRTFGDDGQGHLALNGRRIFLRSEANCAEFPETGYPPMQPEEWESILRTYQSYGVNCVRFHSHCPPEAAFTAADRLGMLMQPELSHWNPKDAFESEESYAYYKRELTCILHTLANHPSFVMLTFGNELCALEKGKRRMADLLKYARSLDCTRLYACASNPCYGAEGADEESDFYTAQQFKNAQIRGSFAGGEKGIPGFINNVYPNTENCYDQSFELLRKTYAKPVFSFEVGQYEVLPDFSELDCFRGISIPDNLRIVEKKMRERGLENVWNRYVEATGELSRLAYREEIEAALRTKEMSGISLLGLQDFPGQGTALVGMMNSHLQPKPFPFARPEEFGTFFADRVILAYMPKYTWENTEMLRVQVKVANYGKEDLTGSILCEVRSQEGETLVSHRLDEVCCPTGGLTEAGRLELSLGTFVNSARLELRLSLDGITNQYPVWVYPPVKPVCPQEVHETVRFDEEARRVLRKGGTVYLTPPSAKDNLPTSIQAQFTTDFWSVGTFGQQEGGMGQLIDDKHPVFDGFPTEFHTNWQWWPMAVQRAVILPRAYETIITEMDSCARLRPMAKLLECRCMGGKVLFSSMGLQDLQRYPEARALLDSIYRYLGSEKFQPVQEIAEEEIAAMVR